MDLPRGCERQRTERSPDARWMTENELQQMKYESSSILLGTTEGEWIGSKDDRHLMTVAGSRAGKSSTCLKPNLFLWPGSVLCIDPKGELAEDTAVRRAAMGQNVIVLDPFGEVKGAAAQFRQRYNPLSEIQAGAKDSVIDNAAMVAEALITTMEGGKNDHWTLSAKNLLRGLILFSMTNHSTLNAIRSWLTLPLESIKNDDSQDTLLAVLVEMMATNVFDGVISGVAGTLCGKPENERGSIISTAVEQTAFLDSLQMKEHLSHSDFETLRLLKRQPTTIYLVLPASRMATHFRWLRIIIALAMAALENEPRHHEHPVLFILEEFPQLGYMRQIESAAGLMAGYGVKLWTVLQDLSQIKAIYRDSWETFIGIAGVIQSFGNSDATTLDYISKALGERQITERQANVRTPSVASSGAKAELDSKRVVNLLAPFEVAQYSARHTGKQLVLFAGRPPAYINRVTHQEVQKMASR